MREVQKESFSEMIRWAREAAGDSVYPLSIAEGVQSGRIFTDDRAYLFWHHCGFAYLAGRPDAQFLSEVENMILQTDPQKQRFLLITDLAEICAYFAKNPMIQTEFRKYYVFYHTLPEPVLPDGYTLKRLDTALTELMSGRIVPHWTTKNRGLY